MAMKKIYLVTFIIALTVLKSISQCAYTFSISSSGYQPLTGATNLNQTQVWTMNSTYNVPLGFSFPLTAGRSTNSVNVFSGSLEFPATTSGYYILLLYHWPFGGNLLTDNGYGTSISQSPISYVISGSPGSRIAKIEFNNAGLEYDHASYCTGTTTGLDYVNFQYWLYESTGRIEVHFGPFSVNNPISYNCGGSSLSGPFMKFVVDNYFLNPYSNVNAPSVTCLNNAGIVYGNQMNGTTGNNGLIHIYDPDPNYSITTGINSLEKNGIKIYPNPTQKTVNISSSSGLLEKDYLIQDLLGGIVKKGTLTEQLDVSDLKQGVYFLKIGNETVKIVIEE